MKTIALFLSKTLLNNCLFLLKYNILALMALGLIVELPDFPQKSFVTSTTEPINQWKHLTKEPKKLISMVRI